MSEKFEDVGHQFKRGILRACQVTGTSPRQVSLKSGFNQNQVGRFLQGRNDILLGTLEKVCAKGLGMTVETVFQLGALPESMVRPG